MLNTNASGNFSEVAQNFAAAHANSLLYVAITLGTLFVTVIIYDHFKQRRQLGRMMVALREVTQRSAKRMN